MHEGEEETSDDGYIGALTDPLMSGQLTIALATGIYDKFSRVIAAW